DYILFYIFFFFFSSRRRHTRCLSDWSSDVCSSDLSANAVVEEAADTITRCDPGQLDLDAREHRPAPFVFGIATPRRGRLSDAGRSEERRVGKECRWGWAA